MPVASMKPSDDPLDEVLKPPPDETIEQRELRLEREEKARQVSAAIDASIKSERQARKKKRVVRLLLLGQSESGESCNRLGRGNVLTVHREIYHFTTYVFTRQ